MSRRPISNTLPKLAHLLNLDINTTLHSTSILNDVALNVLSQHLQEYLQSLIISQLEFKFPLVFSKIARRRFAEQENAISVVSHSLNNDSSLVLPLLNIIEHDMTATTAYQILSKNGFTANFDIV